MKVQNNAENDLCKSEHARARDCARCVVTKRNTLVVLELIEIMPRLQSAIRKKMAPRAAVWVDRHVGYKFTVFVWEFNGK